MPSSRCPRAASAGPTCGPTAGENDVTAGATIGHECVGVVEEVGRRGDVVPAGRLRDRAVLPQRQHLPALPGRGAVGLRQPGLHRQRPGGVRPVDQADGSLVSTDGMPDAALIPSLLALSDVMPTGWHAAVAAGVRPAAPRSWSATAPSGCAACWPPSVGAEKVVAMSRHEPRQAIARRFGATHVVAERGKEGARGGQGDHRGSGRRRSPRVRRHRRLDADGVRRRPARRDGGLRGRPARRGAARRPDVPEEHRSGAAAWHRSGATCPTCSSCVLSGAIDPGRVFDLTLPLEEAAEGYRAMDERRAVKVLLQP